jgi:hypothetical protein
VIPDISLSWCRHNRIPPDISQGPQNLLEVILQNVHQQLISLILEALNQSTIYEMQITFSIPA